MTSLYPSTFSREINKFSIVCDHFLNSQWISIQDENVLEVMPPINSITTQVDAPLWRWERIKIFSVKSIYCFLNDGDVGCAALRKFGGHDAL